MSEKTKISIRLVLSFCEFFFWREWMMFVSFRQWEPTVNKHKMLLLKLSKEREYHTSEIAILQCQ